MTRSSFTAASIREFLSSGWVLSLDSKQILVGWGEGRAAEAPENRSGFASLFAPDFYLETNAPWRVFSRWEQLDRDAFAAIIGSAIESMGFPKESAYTSGFEASGRPFHWTEPKEETFFSYFETIRKNMVTDGLQKAVPVVFAEAKGELTFARKLHILRSLLRLPSTLHLYGYWSQDAQGRSEGILGATPEMLFEKGKLAGEFETVAIAGTLAKSQGEAAAANVREGEELLSDPKERLEHQIVVDDIRDVLAPLGQVEVGDTGVLELPTLFHLKTPIHGRLREGAKFEDLVRVLHPTPALGVAPRRLGFTEMRRWDEPSRRWRYGAPFGIMARLKNGDEVGKCVVAIRNIQWQDQLIRLGSGCGVVGASDPVREWRELQLKRESVRRMLGV
jgi:menaquinone-specific isochorismate synthase